MQSCHDRALRRRPRFNQRGLSLTAPATARGFNVACIHIMSATSERDCNASLQAPVKMRSSSGE